MVNYHKKLVTIFGHGHLYIKHASQKKRRKMESDGEKNAGILVNYKHGWKTSGPEGFS